MDITQITGSGINRATPGQAAHRARVGESEHSPLSTHRLCLWKYPGAIEDFWLRAKEAHRVVPVLHDWQAIGNFAVAPAELNGDRAVHALFRGEVIHGIGVELVRFQIALGVVDGD